MVYIEKRKAASGWGSCLSCLWRVLVCKPNSVCPGAATRGTGEIIIYLGPPSPTASSGLPAPSTGHRCPARGPSAALFDLAPRGVCLAAPVTRDAGGRLLHHFTHHLCTRQGRGHRLVCFLLHVPSPPCLAARRRLPVRKHGALWCSDFPPRLPGNEAMIRPARNSS